LSSFTGLGKLKDIITTVNDLSLAKAAAFAALSKFNPASLPAPSSSVGVATPGSPQSSPLQSKDKPTTAKTPLEIQREKLIQTATNTETQSSDPKINSLLVRQNVILEQLLTSTNSLVSTNQDILKYTRVRT
jgi:lipoprotein-anchoring transpeptidase ErfK/SrfK